MWNSKVHYRIYKCPPTSPILSQIKLVHASHPNSRRYILISSFHPSLVLPSALFPSGIATKTLNPSPDPHKCYMPRPSHSFCFVHSYNTELTVRIIKLLITQFSPLPCYLVPLRLKYSPQHPILKHAQPMFLPQCERSSFTPIQNNLEIIILHILIYIFLDSKLGDKNSAPNDSKHSLLSVCS